MQQSVTEKAARQREFTFAAAEFVEKIWWLLKAPALWFLTYSPTALGAEVKKSMFSFRTHPAQSQAVIWHLSVPSHRKAERRIIFAHVAKWNVRFQAGQHVNKHKHTKIIHRQIKQFCSSSKSFARTYLKTLLDFFQSQFIAAPLWISDLKSEQKLASFPFTASIVMQKKEA